MLQPKIFLWQVCELLNNPASRCAHHQGPYADFLENVPFVYDPASSGYSKNIYIPIGVNGYFMWVSRTGRWLGGVGLLLLVSLLVLGCVRAFRKLKDCAARRLKRPRGSLRTL